MLAFLTNHSAKTMPSSPVDNAIMTMEEVADYLKVTERTIYRLTGAKKIPAFKVGGEVGASRRRILMYGSSSSPQLPVSEIKQE